MKDVKPKKYLGQHFLKDETIAERIVNSLQVEQSCVVVEIGPGMGVLTKYFVDKAFDFYVSEIDKESVTYLKNRFPQLADKIIEGDFLKLNLSGKFSEKLAIIGNFPYNISSQILFQVYDNRNIVCELVGMFQKEVAERIASAPGKKAYGILSVLLQAYYDIEYLFTVDEHVFSPPPKVKSGVVRLVRKQNIELDCDEVFFKQIVKVSFNQRRKMLRNSLKAWVATSGIKNNPIFDK